MQSSVHGHATSPSCTATAASSNNTDATTPNTVSITKTTTSATTSGGEATATKRDPAATYPANSGLSKEEREFKRRNKRELKMHRKRIKLETRIRHSIVRSDPKIESEARKELHDHLLCMESEKFAVEVGGEIQELSIGNDEPRSGDIAEINSNVATAKMTPMQAQVTKGPGIQSRVRKVLAPLDLQKNVVIDSAAHANAKTLVLSIIGDLFHRVSISTDVVRKEQEGKLATQLLKHMNKGTQTKEMFEGNEMALRGYTRRKFLERAMLLCNSLLQLADQPDNMAISPMTEQHEQYSLPQPSSISWESSIWTSVRNIKRACSIGCGPGNDLVGILALIQSSSPFGTSTPPPHLDEALLLDWAQADWKSILTPLGDILSPKHVNKFTSSLCDVTQSLHSSPCNQTVSRVAHTFDFFSVSYLLTETRGKWERFFSELMMSAKCGAMFFFAEPTTWQLHILIGLWKRLEGLDMEYMWLDSSMYFYALQELDGRVGPAVLFAVKRSHTV